MRITILSIQRGKWFINLFIYATTTLKSTVVSCDMRSSLACRCPHRVPPRAIPSRSRTLRDTPRAARYFVRKRCLGFPNRTASRSVGAPTTSQQSSSAVTSRWPFAIRARLLSSSLSRSMSSLRIARCNAPRHRR